MAVRRAAWRVQCSFRDSVRPISDLPSEPLYNRWRDHNGGTVIARPEVDSSGMCSTAHGSATLKKAHGKEKRFA